MRSVSAAKVQIAVYKLSKAGRYIDDGMVASAASELYSGTWEGPLKDAGSKFGVSADIVLAKIDDLKSAAGSGDAAKAKAAYVSAASALKDFAVDAKISENHKLL